MQRCASHVNKTLPKHQQSITGLLLLCENEIRIWTGDGFLLNPGCVTFFIPIISRHLCLLKTIQLLPGSKFIPEQQGSIIIISVITGQCFGFANWALVLTIHMNQGNYMAAE